MRYKKSMFNYAYLAGEDKVLLYNSFVGFDSLATISKSDYNMICDSLLNDTIEDNPKFQTLKKLGYFVDCDLDEKLLREQKYMDTVEENVLRLIILPTEQCNFRCKYCYETFEKGRMELSTQESLIKFVRKNIMRFSSMEVRWFGGEPLEALDVIENLSNAFISICRQSKRPYSAAMTTNGYNLTLDVFQKLYKLHVYGYQITIDGIEATHNNQRILINGQGTFERIIENLKNIKINVKSGVPRFTIRTNFTKYMSQFIDEYLEYFSALFSDDFRFSFSFQKAADWGGERVKKISGDLMDNDFYMELLKKIAKSNMRLDISSHGALMNGKTCVCYANKRYSFVVGADGLIYKCTGDFKFEQNHVGQLQDGEMILDSKRHSKWICKGNRKYEKCDECFFSGACLSASCPASFIKNQKEEDGLCLFEKSFIDCFLDLFDDKYYTKI